MGPEYFCWGGWGVFPFIMPLVMFVVVMTILYFAFRRGGDRPPWRNDSVTAIELLKKRYAKGEVSREEFEQIKKDLLL